MAVGSKSFPARPVFDTAISPLPTDKNPSLRHTSRPAIWLQVAVAYLLIQATLWTMPPTYHNFLMALATVAILLFTLIGGYSRHQMGLTSPRLNSTLRILALGLIPAAALPFAAMLLGQPVPATPSWPSLYGMWEYAIWATVQQFILQSFFFIRLESLLDGRRAVWAAAVLFSAAHIPNPVLTVGTFLGALFFCEMFRRYRTIYPLGIAHAACGLALAESVPQSLLRHMRVGIAYIHFLH